jgi:hypothetical protein
MFPARLKKKGREWEKKKKWRKVRKRGQEFFLESVKYFKKKMIKSIYK